jgi:hypothetical protein
MTLFLMEWQDPKPRVKTPITETPRKPGHLSGFDKLVQQHQN